MLNSLQINKKNYTLLTLPLSNRQNFEDSGKVPAVSVFEFHSIAVQLYQSTQITQGGTSISGGWGAWSQNLPLKFLL